MSKLQSIVLTAGLGLFCLLYFGFSLKPEEFGDIERKRTVSSEITDISNLIRDVQDKLSSDQKSYLFALEKEIEISENKSNKKELLKKLSGKWFEFGQPQIAGFYAEKIAEEENTVEAWSIAGTTYAATFKSNLKKKVKDYALNKATASFENAISLDPDAIQPKVNLALCYVENPLQDNPMKGILMLLDLNKQNPDEPLILTNLGRLAIQTGQYEKAIQRLEKVLELVPNNRNANCLLSQAYSEIGNKEKAAAYLKKCN